METRFIEAADGVQIAHRLYGAGAPTLVFVHGWCGDRSVWDSLIEELEMRCRILTIDLAGHGESGSGRRRYSMAAFGDDVARCVEATSDGPVVLIGHSMAGDVIVEAALRLESRAVALIGVDTLWNPRREIGPEEIEQILGPFRRDYRQALEDYVRAMFLPGADPLLVEGLVASMAAVPGEVGLSALEEVVLNRPALREGLNRLQQPFFLLNSEDWRATDPGSAATYRLIVRHLRNVGHFSMLEAPSEVALGIEKIVGSLEIEAL